MIPLINPDENNHLLMRGDDFPRGYGFMH
jgi:hypothetical protein